MQYFKILLFLITFSSVSNAAYLYDQQNRCVDDYYIDRGTLYYLRSGESNWRSTTTKKTVVRMLDGYEYDYSTGNCNKSLISPEVKNYSDMLIGFFVVTILVWSLI